MNLLAYVAKLAKRVNCKKARGLMT